MRRPPPADQLADAVDAVLQSARMPLDLGEPLLRAFERFDGATGYRARRYERDRRAKRRQGAA